MSNLWKRVLSVILAVVMVIAGLPSMGIGVASVQADTSSWDGTGNWPPAEFNSYSSLGAYGNQLRFSFSSGSNSYGQSGTPSFANLVGDGNGNYWVDLTDLSAGTGKTVLQNAQAGNHLYLGLVNNQGQSYQWHTGRGVVEEDAMKKSAHGVKATPENFGDTIDNVYRLWQLCDIYGANGDRDALPVKIGVKMWVTGSGNDPSQKQCHYQFYTKYVWRPGAWKDLEWTWSAIQASTSATAKYVNYNTQEGVDDAQFDLTDTVQPVPQEEQSNGDMVFTARADFTDEPTFQDSATWPARPVSSKTFSSAWQWGGIWAAATDLGTPTTASATYSLKSYTGNIKNLDTNESYTLETTVSKTKTGDTAAKLSAQVNSAFGTMTPSAEKNFTLTWGDWSADYSTISATFTNDADPTDTYTVSQATVTQAGSKNRATVYFCGLPFTTDSDDLTSTYEENNWRWTAYNSVEDTYPAVLTLDEYKGSAKTGVQVPVNPLPTYLTSAANPPANGYTYVKGSDEKTTMNAYAPYDGKNYTTSPTYTKVFNAPNWDWPSLQKAEATFVDSKNTSESYTREATGSKIEYVKAPERKSDGSYLLTKKATVTFLKNDFESPAQEFTVTPTITIIPPTPIITVTPGGPTPTTIPETSTVFADNWIWDAYSEANDNIKATATIGEFVEDYSTTVPVFVTDIADEDTANKAKTKNTDNKTKNTATGSNDRHVYFQGQVQYNGKTFTSGEREFKLEKTEWTDFTTCVFTFKEVGSYAKGTPETITITGTTPKSLGLEYETDSSGNRIGTMKQTWQSTATLGGCQFTSEKEETGIEIDDIPIWEYTNYLYPTEPSERGYTVSVKITENGETTPTDSATGLAVTAVKNADSETILTPKEAGQVVKKNGNLYFHSNVTGKDYLAVSETVNAPEWRWNADNSQAWATFTQKWNSWKTNEIEAKMSDSARVEDKANKRYVWTRTATVTFCGNKFTSEYQLWVPIKEVDTPSYTEDTGWTWGTYRPADDNYTATVHIQKVWFKNDVAAKTETKDIADEDTRSPKSKDESTVYFQGSVDFDGFTLTSSERCFTVDSVKVWDTDAYKSCKFTFNEDAASVLNDKIERVATYPKGEAGEITYGKLVDDDQNLGKLMRDVNAEVTFGGAKFKAKDVQHNIDPDGYDVEWTWSEYDKKNDKYTATYKITVRNTGTSVNGDGTTVDADAKAPDKKETTLTAKIPTTDPFYSKVDEKDRTKTRTVKAPTWNWANDKSKADATFVEDWDAGKTLDPFAGKMSDSDRVHDTQNKRYVWTRTAEVTFCGNKFTSEYQLNVTDTENSSDDSQDAGWKWSQYDQTKDNYTATVYITKVIIENGVPGTPEKVSVTDNDTRSPKSTDNGKVYFQGEVTYDGVKITSDERSFTLANPVAWDTSKYLYCDFTFNEDASSALNDQIVRRATYPKGVAGEITYGPLEADEHNRGKSKRTVDAEVTFGGAYFEADTVQRNIKDSEYSAEWTWSEYIPSGTNGDKYTASVIVYNNDRHEEIDRHTVNPANMVKNADETTTLSASYTSSIADNETFTAPQRTVSAPVWVWSADSSTATATFTEQWGSNKTIVFSGSQVTIEDLAKEHDTVNHLYRLTRRAKVTFCRNEFTSLYTIEYMDDEGFEVAAGNGWTWEKYSQANDNITATVHIVEKIMQNGKVLEEKTKDLVDNDTIVTSKSQGSEGSGTVYFQGVVEYNGMTLSSNERVFKCTGHDWTANTYEKCTFKMVENGGLSEKVDRVAPDSKDSSLVLGEYIPDGSKFKRKADAYVFFGKCKFIADDWQTDIDYKVDWKWSKYIAKDDKYTATYTISLPTTGETLETDTVDAVAVKDAASAVTTLTATAESKKYGTFKDTRTVNAPKWDWKAAKDYKEAGATFVENWTDGETLPEFAAIVSKDTDPKLNAAGDAYEISRTATVTFCHNQFTSDYGLSLKVKIGPSTGLGSENGWTWSKYDQAADNFTATAHITPYTIEDGVRKDEAIVDVADTDTVLKDKSKDNGTVYFQGEVEYRGFTLTSNERSFVKDSHTWEPSTYATCTFTFRETTANATFTESYDRVAPTSTGSKITFGNYEPSKKYEGKFQRTADAYVYFGKCKFDVNDIQDKIDYIVDWVWSDYLPAPQDKYTATYTIKLPSSNDVLETNTVDASAVKDPTSAITTLRATAISTKYGVFTDTRTVNAPVWTWNEAKENKEASASFTESWTSGKTLPDFAGSISPDTAATLNPTTKWYSASRTATVTFCRNQFTSDISVGWPEKEDEDKTHDDPDATPTPTPTSVPGQPGSYEEPDNGWTWTKYSQKRDNITATAHIVVTKISDGVAGDPKVVHIPDTDTVVKSKSSNNGTVYFQGEVTYSGFKITSKERSFINKKHEWDKSNYETCDFTFEENGSFKLDETIVRTAKKSDNQVTHGSLVESKTDPTRMQRDVDAWVLLGGFKFDAHDVWDGIDPNADISWTWSSYNAAKDEYTATFTVKSILTGEVLETGDGVVTVVKETDGKTTLTAKGTSKKGYAIPDDTRTVNAPTWTWVNHADGRVYASFKEAWDGGTTVERNATVTKGTEYLPVPDGREMYYLMHAATVNFCKNPFDDEDEEEKPPTFDKIVTPTPTPVGFTPTPTPSVGPGTPTPMPEDQKSIIIWSWDDYKAALNGKDANGNYKGNFNQATATLHDDQRGFFTKSYTADGKKTGTGGITITSPTTPINPATIKYTAEIEHTTSNGAKRKVQDALNFALPTWEWEGNTSATATFTESNGKEFGKTPTTKVSITTKDIAKEPTLTTTTYTATAYFGERKYQDSQTVTTDYVVYLRWPSMWNVQEYDPNYNITHGAVAAFNVYCYIYDKDDPTINNGTTASPIPGRDPIKGQPMERVSRLFLNYATPAGDFKTPVVEFYNIMNKKLPTPGTQFMDEDGSTEDINELVMRKKGDWLFYQAGEDTAASKNTWKLYLPEVNGHSLTIVESGLIGLNFKVDLPERYGNSGTVQFSIEQARDEFGSTIRYQASDRQPDGRYNFSRAIRAYRMANKVTATISYNSGSLNDVYCVQDYLEMAVDRADAGEAAFERLKDVICSLNNYGWYAQKGLNNTYDPVPMARLYENPALPSNEDAMATFTPYKASVQKASNVSNITFPLQCWEDIRINVYVYTEKLASVTAEIIARDDQGAVPYTPELVVEPETYRGRVLVSIRGIPLNALDKFYTLKITSDGQTSTVKVAGLSQGYKYLLDEDGSYADSQSSKDLAKAYYFASKALDAFFTGK